MLLIVLALFSGCTGQLQIINRGPNPIQVTTNPSPDSPPLPLVIPVDPQIPPPHILTWENVMTLPPSFPVEVTAVDTVTFQAKVQTIDVLIQDPLVGGSGPTIVTWNGTEFVPGAQ